MHTAKNGRADIVAALEKMGDGARVEVAILWGDGQNGGHVFVAENLNGAVLFHDPQKGLANVENYFDDACDGATRYWRIDNLAPSDRGVSACEKA